MRGDVKNDVIVYLCYLHK